MRGFGRDDTRRMPAYNPRGARLKQVGAVIEVGGATARVTEKRHGYYTALVYVKPTGRNFRKFSRALHALGLSLTPDKDGKGWQYNLPAPPVDGINCFEVCGFCEHLDLLATNDFVERMEQRINVNPDVRAAGSGPTKR
jgi:hypothetical protein